MGKKWCREKEGLKSQIENAGEESMGRRMWRGENGFKSQIESVGRTGRDGGGGEREDGNRTLKSDRRMGWEECGGEGRGG